jgi:hypothetical protein
VALTRADYLEHFRSAVGRALLQSKDGVPLLIAGLVDYIQTGNRGTIADRREAARVVLNVLWQGVLNRPYDGHQMRHWLLDAGVDLSADIPNIAEPLV